MRSRLISLAAAVLISGAALSGCGADDSDDPGTDETPSVAPSPEEDEETETAEEPSASATMQVPAEADARCVAPSAETLQTVADQAFEAVAESVVDDTVTLTPSTWYAGEEAAEVNVQAPSPELQQVLLGVGFTEGERYLVAASGGQLVLCGMTGPWSADLEAMYVEAFPAE